MKLARQFKAIAAMSQNRVIGAGNRIPWYLPEDFRWFKQTTLGHVLVMGRRTFESIGRVLPGRETIVVSRSGRTWPGVRVAPDLEALEPPKDGRLMFFCGGAAIYACCLPFCAELYLTVVTREVEGDAFFPPFEDHFERVATLRETVDFTIEHYRNRNLGMLMADGESAAPARPAR